jgi:hypothetical protein
MLLIMKSFFKSFNAGILYLIIAAACAPFVVTFVAHAESSESEPSWVALHAAPYEVSPIVLTLLSDDPLLAESAPVLIASDDSEMPPRQNPWHWVEVTGTFIGYIPHLKMDESKHFRPGTSVLAAPDLDSPSLIRAKAVMDSLHVVSREGPFWKVNFRATLPLFVDFDATPLVDDIKPASVVANSDSAAIAPGSSKHPIEDDAPLTMRFEGSSEALIAEADATPFEPSPVVRILRGRLVSSREARIHRALFQHVIVSPAGTPLAYADLQFFRSSALSSIIGKEGIFTGAVVPQGNNRSALPVMQIRTFRIH